MKSCACLKIYGGQFNSLRIADAIAGMGRVKMKVEPATIWLLNKFDKNLVLDFFSK